MILSVVSFKKNCLTYDFIYILLNFFELCSLLCRGRKSDEVKFERQIELLLPWSFDVSFKKTVLTLILYRLFS